MEQKNVLKESNAANASMDVMSNLSNYNKIANHMQQQSGQLQQQQQQQQQHYQKSNSIQTEYPNLNGSSIDLNCNNYGPGHGSCGSSSSLLYFNDSIMNSSCNTNSSSISVNNSNNNNTSNNNSISFPNQNYKLPSKYTMSGNHRLPPTGGGGVGGVGGDGVNMVNPASIVNTTACQYAHNYGGASCYNRNRYMPYNHNRACAAAASAVAIGVGIRTTAPNTYCSSTKTASAANNNNNNIAIIPTMLYSSYQQQFAATTYPNFMPMSMSQPNNHPITTMPHLGLDGTNSYLMTSSYDPTIPSAQVDCMRYPLSLQPNFIPMPLRGTENDTVTLSACTNNNNNNNSQNAMVYGMPCSSAACTTASSTSIVSSTTANATYASVTDLSQAVSLRLTNLDYTMDEESLRKFLMGQLKPITPVVSLTFEDCNFATVTVPDSYFAKQVVANLHRKKIGHKRMVVSYTRDSSLTEANTLRCQVAGLLKDVPYNRLPLYKFRELFQSRFKTSINVLDLYTMRDICMINADGNEEKFITLLPSLVSSLENSPLMEGLQHTVPYCKEHFKREQHKGWAEQEIEPLPNIIMSLAEIQNIIHPLLKSHHGDIPVSSLIHCTEGQLKIKIEPNENGVNLEHLVCCIQGIKIQPNNFGIKILAWIEADRKSTNGTSVAAAPSTNSSSSERGLYFKSADPLGQITREVIELVKMSPKSTMKFSRFIPAYHSHFGKQCRVADYGYTKLIELFEGLSSVVQIMGDGENRQITLTHRTQIRRFTSDILRILRGSENKSVLLSELPQLFTQSQNRKFDITDYGVCNIGDILDGLVHSNVVAITKVQNGKDILISMPKRQQSGAEISKTCVFAGEMVELCQNAPQYSILFQKFVRSYHYHFSYQCRLSDYGFLKLADLMEAINGVVEMDRTNDEDRRIYLSPLMARRVFAEQSEELIRIATGSSKTPLKLKEVLKLHKKKYGYQILPETLGVEKLENAIELLPYVEVTEENDETWMTCHNHDPIFRTLCYRACKHLLAYDPHKYRSWGIERTLSTLNNSVEQKRKPPPSLDDFIIEFNAKHKENLNINMVKAMQYVIEIFTEGTNRYVRITEFMNFVINIVRLLEQRSVLVLSEIKSTLGCSIKATFSFGYPNLFTLLTAYPDIFIVNMGVSQETSEVRLAPNCELIAQRNIQNSPKVANAPINNKSIQTKQPPTKSNINRLARPPLAECNGRNFGANQNGPPLAKMRNIMSAEEQANFDGYNIPNFNNYPYQPPNTEMISALALQQNRANNNNNIQCFSSCYSSGASNNATFHNSTFLNSSLSNYSGVSNKENSLNSSLNTSLNSSNNSMIDLNASLLCNNSMHFSSTINSNANTSKLWERRLDTIMSSGHHQSNQSNVVQQENAPTKALQPLVIPASCNSSLTLNGPLISQRSINSIINSIENGPPGTPLWGPPKPDTPPTHNMPFWMDPIWSHDLKTQRKIELINTTAKHSDGQMPMILSPYTLSKIYNLNKTFNFESPDRKIS